MNKSSIDAILNYKNKNVVEFFSEKYKINFNDSKEIFEDTLRFLFLGHYCNKNGIEISLFIDHSIAVIDEMWHLFILHTHDYHSFCEKYFGYFIHHTPTSVSEKTSFSDLTSKMSKEDVIALLQEKKRPLYYLVYEFFGEEVFKRWFTYYKKYSFI